MSIEYQKLVEVVPECKNDTITSEIKFIKQDLINLSEKVTITEYLIETENQNNKNEIRHLRLINFILIFTTIGIIFLSIRIKKYV